jgi:hypothetical protein
MKKTLTLFICAFLLHQVYAQSQPLSAVIWTFESQTPTATNPYTPNLIASDVTDGGGVTIPSSNPTGYAQGSGGAGFAVIRDGWDNSTSDNAFNAGEYFEFTLTPSTGFNLTITGVTAKFRRSTTGPPNLAIRSKTGTGSWTSDLATGTASSTSSFVTVNFSLSGYTQITDPVSFRIMGYGGSSTAGTLRIDDISFITGSVLPIETTTFNAKTSKNTTLLSWATASERNNAQFLIERSTDASSFSEIGHVTGSGNSDIQQNYVFTDYTPATGINFYRLKQVDFDGHFSYSPVVSVSFGGTKDIRLSPMPVSEHVRVTLSESSKTDGLWQVFDFSGRLMQSGTVDSESTEFSIDATSFAPGSYVLRIVNGQQVISKAFQK